MVPLPLAGGFHKAGLAPLALEERGVFAAADDAKRIALGRGTQHGMRTRGEAPIFELADFGVEGDILEIIPKLTEAINNAKS